MNETDAMELVQAALWQVMVVAGPMVIPAMVAGIVIALVQALTQVQEATLTFVPKMLVVFASIMLMAPFIGAELAGFTEMIYGRVQSGF
ncbi:MAG TPA: flagellar biosynthesis protein FliQ [Aestuariivirga sp.]|jgi:flagellar biosynthetic protein FliQ|nr:flagellar biosynthesis protein FliQ [Aestuariivirga sp.]